VSEAAVIEAVGLTKCYGDLVAVRDVSFRVERGEVVGFLGPNGAGKTTTLRVLAGVLPPTGGIARIHGHDVMSDARAAKRHLGYLPERPPLYPEMTPRAYLTFVAKVKGLRGARARSEVERTMAETELGAVSGRLIAGLSRGYQQRIAMAQALLGEPPLLLFDEPTLGLDPQQMQFVRAMVKRLSRDRTVFISTHFLAEVEAICSRVLIIQEGRLLIDAPLAEVTGRRGAHRLVVRLGGDFAGAIDRAHAIARETPGVRSLDPDPSNAARFEVSCDEAEAVAVALAARIVGAGLPLAELRGVQRRLEDVYLEVIAADTPATAPGGEPNG
jgi:ABC-2 type transport system ATP-binding protein